MRLLMDPRTENFVTSRNSSEKCLYLEKKNPIISSDTHLHHSVSQTQLLPSGPCILPTAGFTRRSVSRTRRSSGQLMRSVHMAKSSTTLCIPEVIALQLIQFIFPAESNTDY